MKKVLFVLPFILLLGACREDAEPLPSVAEDAKTVKLTKANCGLTGEDSTAEFTTALDIEGTESKYEFLIGPNCYAHATYEEFLIKKDGYIKSKSEYHVDRLIIDYMSKKAINFEVLNASGEVVESHASSVATEYPAAEDYGAVVEYSINGTAWTIRNTTDYKPAFYSVTVVFTM